MLQVRWMFTGETTARRVLLPLAVVLAVLATAGWIARAAETRPDVFERQLLAWERGSFAGRPLPEPGAPAEDVSRYFDGLTPRQRLRLADDYPLVVGNLPGAPLPLRYRANRLALAQARDAERRRMHDERLSPAGQQQAGRRMHRYESMLEGDRRFLAFDPTGRGRAAEVFGDLAGADRITVVVPGVKTDILDFERTHGRYTAPSGMGQALHRAQRRAAPPGTRTAVIAWAGYQAPTGLGMSAATTGLAEAGAERLLALVPTLPGRAEVTLACHSYGSVVCGLAADELPARVTDIAVAGSPGMRAGDVEGLDTAARVWAMRAADDWIADIPHVEIGPFGHGNDPATPGFGARLLSTGNADGHGGYFVPGTASLRNLALVGAGEVNDVACAPGSHDCAPLDPCVRAF